MSSLELSDAIHERVKALCATGDELAGQGRYPEALKSYWSAWDLLPLPPTDWSAATWLLVAIGDVNFSTGDFTAGRDNLALAMHCPDAIGNPFIHLRLGQCQFEIGNVERAADELARAFLLEGRKVFEGEDPKYLAFVKTQLREPEGGWAPGW